MLHHLDSDNVKKVVDTIMGMTVFLKVFCFLLMRQKKYWILQIIKDVIQNSSLLCYQKLEFFYGQQHQHHQQQQQQHEQVDFFLSL